jgi:hypothetical protein
VLKYLPEGKRNIRRFQSRGGHLVEQRLKHVMIFTINQDDSEIGPVESFRKVQAGETATHNNYGWKTVHATKLL